MKQFFGKKSRSTLALVIMASLILHIIAGIIFGTIKFVEALREEEKTLQAVEIQQTQQQEKVTKVNVQQRTKSTPPPRPPAITVNRPTDLSIPELDIKVDIDLSSVQTRSAGSISSNAISDLKDMAIGDLKLTDFGYSGKAAGTLEGTLIDLKRDKDGKSKNTDRISAIRTFTDGTWTLSRWTDNFYSAENKLYASYWIIGMGSAAKAPEAFGVKGEIAPSGIVAYYTGEYTPTNSMNIRFCGSADDLIIVRINSRIVLDGGRDNRYSKFNQSEYERGKPLAGMNTTTTYGEWINLRAGSTYDMQVLLAEVPGGSFGCALFYQTKSDAKEGIHRVFSTKPFTEKEIEMLSRIHPDVAKGLK